MSNVFFASPFVLLFLTAAAVIPEDFRRSAHVFGQPLPSTRITTITGAPRTAAAITEKRKRNLRRHVLCRLKRQRHAAHL